MKKKKIGLLEVFCIATGAMISSGIFILPGIAHESAGPALIASYLIAGLLAATGLLSQAELVSAMPKTGGTYFYVTRSMGPCVGTVNGLVTWISLSLKSSFALVGMAAFTAILTPIDIRIIAVVLCIGFVLANIAGVKEAAGLQVVLVILIISILGYYIAKGFPAVNMHNLAPFAPKGSLAVFTTAGTVFISYGGLLKVAAIAEDVENPGKTVPLGMILSLLLVTVLYTLITFITAGVLGDSLNGECLTPLSDAAEHFMGSTAAKTVSIAAILAFISTANAGIMAASRYPTALARDGLIPEILARNHPKFGTPYISIILTGVMILTAVFLNLNVLVKVASTVLIMTFLFSCVSVLIMRESRLQNYRPQFRSPCYPWVQFIGIIGSTLLIIRMGSAAISAVAVMTASGLFVYWVYGRIRTTREYALLHLIERITSREITDNLLETELKEIIRERDDITTDRFDRLLEESDILDIDHAINMSQFFDIVSRSLSDSTGISHTKLVHLLTEREEESSTVITKGISIPHIILPGEKQFKILIARCSDGITFDNAEENVQAVFVLTGTKDERNFHLRALSAIAQIVQDPEFLSRWQQAKSTNGLRDILLLGKRIRDNANRPL